MADTNSTNVTEVAFVKEKHGKSQRGGLVADKDGALGFPAYEMPQDVLFDLEAASALPADLKKDLAGQNLSGGTDPESAPGELLYLAAKKLRGQGANAPPRKAE